MKKKISFSIPCYNEELNVIPCYEALSSVTNKFKRYRYEYIFVDNGSTDQTRKRIRLLVKKYKNVIGVFLSRNFGPEASGHAGMDKATGDAVIPFECDLQDPPELVEKFINKWEEGYDIVVGVRTKIEDNLMMTFLRKSFYKLLRAMSDIEVPINAGGCSLMTRRVLDALHSLPEKYRFHRGLRAWVGFRTTYITYERHRRERGTSSYNLWKYLQHAERSFFGFSYLQLDLMVYAGLFLVSLSFLFLFVYLFTMYLVYRIPLNSLVMILSAIILFGGIQLLALSIVGKYVQVIVEETKARPLYIIEEVIGEKNKGKH